ncbi:hypothetical protein CR513_47465, partial [Mucuna pruriens]
MGVQPNELGFTLVDLDKVGYKEKPFVMASQAKQVCHVSNKRWEMNDPSQSISGVNMADSGSDEISSYFPKSKRMMKQMTRLEEQLAKLGGGLEIVRVDITSVHAKVEALNKKKEKSVRRNREKEEP